MATERHIRRSGGGLSWFALILGIGIGVAIGLIYTWEIDPVIETNTHPWQLSEQSQENYIVAVALSYAYNRDRQLAFDRLRELKPDQQVWSMVAEVACRRVETGKISNNADIRVLRAMVQLYAPQDASGCADSWGTPPAPMITVPTAVPTLTPMPTLTPPATKTPTPPLPTNAIAQPPRATNTPSGGGYALSRLQSFCNPDAPGIIEVRVYDSRGRGVPGLTVQAIWRGDEVDTFYTGLKPEREPGYADFEMTPGLSYTIVIPNLVSDPPAVEADSCQTTVDGETISTTTSYWVNFQQRSN